MFNLNIQIKLISKAYSVLKVYMNFHRQGSLIDRNFTNRQNLLILQNLRSFWINPLWNNPMTAADAIQPPPLASQPSVVKQRIAYNPSLHLRSSSLQLASSPVIYVKRGQGCRSEAITDFSDQVHIWWRPRLMYCLPLGWNMNLWVK